MTTEQLMNELSDEQYLSLPRLGWVFTFEAPQTVEVLSHQQTQDILERYGYDYSQFPVSDNKTYFCETRNRMQDMRLGADPRILIRPLGNRKQQIIRYQVTIEKASTVQINGTDADVLDHTRNMIVQFDRKMDKGDGYYEGNPISFAKEHSTSVEDRKFMLDFEACYNRIKQNILARNLYDWTLAQVHKWNVVRWRTAGGMFFVPDDFTPQLDQLMKVYDDIGAGALLKRIPILNSEESRRDVAHSFDFEMEQQISTLNDELDALIQRGRSEGTLPQAMLRNRITKYENILNDAGMYHKILKGRTDLVTAAIKVVKDKTQQILDNKFYGITAELSPTEQKKLERAKRREEREARKAAELTKDKNPDFTLEQFPQSHI
jgi:hypothetical protein